MQSFDDFKERVLVTDSERDGFALLSERETRVYELFSRHEQITREYHTFGVAGQMQTTSDSHGELMGLYERLVTSVPKDRESSLKRYLSRPFRSAVEANKPNPVRVFELANTNMTSVGYFALYIAAGHFGMSGNVEKVSVKLNRVLNNCTQMALHKLALSFIPSTLAFLLDYNLPNGDFREPQQLDECCDEVSFDDVLRSINPDWRHRFAELIGEETKVYRDYMRPIDYGERHPMQITADSHGDSMGLYERLAASLTPHRLFWLRTALSRPFRSIIIANKPNPVRVFELANTERTWAGYVASCFAALHFNVETNKEDTLQRLNGILNGCTQMELHQLTYKLPYLLLCVLLDYNLPDGSFREPPPLEG